MRLISTCFRTLLLIASVALLSACGYTTEQEVRSFIDTERAALHPVSKVIPAPKPFQAAVYEVSRRQNSRAIKLRWRPLPWNHWHL